jgi:hypothetical protein
MSAAAVVLPAGFWLDGIHYREAELRPLTGEDEAFLESVAARPPARRATLLLARCLERLGPWETVPPETVASLTVGDREALLLHLRRLTLGDRLQCVLRCPAPACGERMDLDLDVRELLLPPYPDPAPRHDVAIEASGTPWRVRFRLPTGGDQEAAAPLVRSDLAAAIALILRRCIAEIVREDGELAANIPAAVADPLAARMAELDPQAELTLQLNCPVCGAQFSTQLDAATYLFQELTGAKVGLWHEVHLLALYYHWSETEILRLTRQKRRLYLGLLADSLGGERWR